MFISTKKYAIFQSKSGAVEVKILSDSKFTKIVL